MESSLESRRLSLPSFRVFSGNLAEWLRLRIFLLGAVGIGGLLVFPLLGTLPGLHGDEAWVGLRAHDILHGARPMLGMNGYTGPLHQYLVALLFHFFGCNVAALRVVTGITALFSIVLYYGAIKRCFDPILAALSTLLLVSLPFFTAYGRIAHEVFALNPVLALAAIWLLLETGGETLRKRLAFPCLAGICLGLGTWNHLIFASVPLALFAAALFRHRASLFRGVVFYAVGYGFLVALCPRLLWQFTNPGQAETMTLAEFDFSVFLGAFFQRLWEWPGLLAQVAHGDILFKRCAGQVPFPTPNFIWPLLLAGIGLSARRAWLNREKARSVEAATLVFALALFLSTAFLCPATAVRYFLLPLYLVPLFLAYPFRIFLRPFGSVGESSSGPAAAGQSSPQAPSSSLFPSFPSVQEHRRGRLARLLFSRGSSLLLLGILLLFQLSRTCLNYFVSQPPSQARSATVLFDRQVETGNHFARTDRLYQRLVQRGAKRIYAEFFIALPLQFYNLGSKAFTFVDVIDSTSDLLAVRSARPELTDGTYAIVYAIEPRRMGPAQYPGFAVGYSDADFLLLAPERVPQPARSE